jgi:hypothetical protein
MEPPRAACAITPPPGGNTCGPAEPVPRCSGPGESRAAGLLVVTHSPTLACA